MPVHAFIFPGQGSQAVGMGRDLAAAYAAAREVFEEVDETLKQKLSKLMFEGPAEELTLTENTQPALMAHSLAVLRVIEREGGITLADKAALVAGHSLGEYTALAAAGAFTPAGAARLLRLRGSAMQKAVPPGAGAMAALLGVELALASEICAEAADGPEGREVVEPANDNGGGQVVISGDKAAVERAIEVARGKGVRRAMLLPVSAPFHCALMAPAADAMAEALEVDPPGVPAGAGGRQRDGGQGDGPRRHHQKPRPPSDRHGPLARERAGDDRVRRRQLHRDRRGQGSVRPGATDRAGRGQRVGRLARRDRTNPQDPVGSARMFRLDGRAALVTGASGGIGAAIARALHAQGASVALSGTRREALDALAGELGERAHVCPAELRDPAACEGLIAAAEAAAGPLHILINNAGLTRDMLALRMKDEDWQAVLDVDLTAPFRLARSALKGMLRRRSGRIISISSIVGATGNAGQANYAAAKAGLVAMSKSLAQEVASRGITVNVVAPGFVQTAMTDVLGESQRTKLADAIPLGRLGQPGDIAAAVVYLASDEASWVTGATLHVNGGMAML